MDICKFGRKTAGSYVYIGEKARWERPFTVKRYLHPPRAEEVVTKWPDGKILFEPVSADTWPWLYTASAVKLLLGETFEEIDFKRIRYERDKDGIPVHAFSCRCGGISLRMEAFCTAERSPAAYVRVTLKNRTPQPVMQKISLLARTGEMVRLTGSEPDGYAHLNTNVRNWGFIPAGFRFDGEPLRDGNAVLRMAEIDSLHPVWQGNVKGVPWHLRGLLMLTCEIPAGGERDLFFHLPTGGTAGGEYPKITRRNAQKYGRSGRGNSHASAGIPSGAEIGRRAKCGRCTGR